MTAPTQQRQLSAAQIAALIALVEAQAKVRAQLTQTAIAGAVAAFQAVTNWWDAAQVDKAVTAALRVVQPAQRQAARVTDAYLARATSVLTGRTERPAGVVDVTKLRQAIPQPVVEALVKGTVQPGRVELGSLRDGPAATINEPIRLVVPRVAQKTTTPAAAAARPAAATTPIQPQPVAVQSTEPETRAARVIRERAAAGAAAKPAVQAKPAVVPPAEPYGRIADAYRFQVVAEGTPEPKALQKALVRIAAVAETDVTLAVREQMRKSLIDQSKVTGYRRIVRPEFSETGPCGLCVVAAARVYHVKELKPIHGRCKCEVLPIVGHLDPGGIINQDDLERVYAAAGGTGGDVIKGNKRHSGRLKNLRVALVEHGELGPILVDGDQDFRGPRQVAATKARDPKVRARAELAALEEKFAQLQRSALAGEDVDKPIRWQANRIDELRHELAGEV